MSFNSIKLLAALSVVWIEANAEAVTIDATRVEAFLADVCTKAPGSAFAAAWLAHEDKFWDFYRPAYYRSESLKAGRKQLAEEMKDRRDEMCKYARTFTLIGPGVIESLTPRVKELTGVEPALPLHFAAALQWTDGNGAEFQGKRVYVFNARHDTYARTTGMAATIIHELIHSSYYDRSNELPPIQASLYHEGVAVYGTQLLLPEVGYGATGQKPDDLERARKIEGNAARELLTHWTRFDADAASATFFQGGQGGPNYPPKMGYYLGLRLFKEVEKDIGAQAAVRIAPKDFITRAKALLEKMAATAK